MELLIATRNTGKFREFHNLFGDIPVRLFGLSDLGITREVEETGSTFTANADLKATAYAREGRILTLADDSGLAIDALGGAPGVFSARWAGENASDAARVEKVLADLSDIAAITRSARFVCAMSIADADGQVLFRAEGICEGRIAFEPRGSGGFGYDPIFVPDGFELSFGELSQSIKDQISHRARATSSIIRFLRGFFAI